MDLGEGERVKGIEPSSRAWKARALPLSYTRENGPSYQRRNTPRTDLRKGTGVGGVAHPSGGCAPASGATEAVTQYPHRDSRNARTYPDRARLKQGKGSDLRNPARVGKEHLVGAGGFEPPTSCSQSRRANQAALRPELEHPKPAGVRICRLSRACGECRVDGSGSGTHRERGCASGCYPGLC